jgi:nucleotide-binding universal stress UspA family protein
VNRFENILFTPLGRYDNPAALRRVVELVENDAARFTLLGVVDAPSRLQRLLHRPGLVDEVVTAERTLVESDLERLADRASTSAETIVEAGDAALSIIERVVTHGHDLVVVTSDEDREDHTTIRRLLRKCPCPVWVIRPTRARIQRVLAAVNPDPNEIELNRTILELASSVVRLHRSELHVVHAWELYGEATMRGSAFLHVPPAELEAMLTEERAKQDEALAELLASVEPPPIEWEVHLIKGPAPQVVPALVAKRRINLLVMGTVARTGVNAMVMGNTAERVLDEVKCSVIAVKPEGFESPIKPRLG